MIIAYIISITEGEEEIIMSGLDWSWLIYAGLAGFMFYMMSKGRSYFGGKANMETMRIDLKQGMIFSDAMEREIQETL